MGSLVVLVVVAAFELRGSRETTTPAEEIPSGTLLAKLGSEIIAVPADAEGRVEGETLLRGSIAGYQVSPDGSELVGTMERREPSGITRQFRIVLIDTSTGATTALLEAGPTEGFAGPFDWSADGQSIAFRMATWRVDPSTELPGEPSELAPCVLDVATGASECFPGVSPVLSVDLSADGSRLLVSGSLGEEVRTLSIFDRGTTDVIPAGGSPEIQAAIEDAGLGSDNDVQFIQSSWSASEAFVATIARVDTADAGSWFLPLIVDREGRLVAIGRPNVDLQQMSWSPSEDVLAYSTGLVGPPDPSDPPHEVRGLNPSNGDDRLLLSTEGTANLPGKSDPFILSLVWSPSGRWLAVGGRDEIRVVDVTGAGTVRVIQPYEGQQGLLEDWIP